MVNTFNWAASASVWSGRLGFVKQKQVESDFFWSLISLGIRLLNVSSRTVCFLTSRVYQKLWSSISSLWPLYKSTMAIFLRAPTRPLVCLDLQSYSWDVSVSSSFLILKNGAYSLSSRDVYSYFTLPKVKTEMGSRAFRFSAPTTWNILQSDHKLHNLAPLNVFRSMTNPITFRPHMYKCFIWVQMFAFGDPEAATALFTVTGFYNNTNTNKTVFYQLKESSFLKLVSVYDQSKAMHSVIYQECWTIIGYHSPQVRCNVRWLASCEREGALLHYNVTFPHRDESSQL